MGKEIIFLITALLLISIFATAFALADDTNTIEDVIAIEQGTVSDVVSAVAPVATDTALSEVSSEVANIAPSVQAPAAQQRYAGAARVTIGNGLIVNLE